MLPPCIRWTKIIITAAIIPKIITIVFVVPTSLLSALILLAVSMAIFPKCFKNGLMRTPDKAKSAVANKEETTPHSLNSLKASIKMKNKDIYTPNPKSVSFLMVQVRFFLPMLIYSILPHTS